jgi:polysaccharide biosynthesis/export protein
MRALAALLLAFVVFGVVSCKSSKVASKEIAERPVAAANDAQKEAVSNVSPRVVLGQGDQVSITVWRNDDLARTVKIDPAGNIYYSFAGEIHAAGLTLAELRDEIAKRLSTRLVNPQVDVNVSSMVSQRVHVLGEVKSPGSYAMDREMQAWEAVAMAGGMTVDAGGGAVLVVRKEGNEARAYAANIAGILKGKDVKPIGPIRNGDIVYVPPSRIASVERFMNRLNNILSPLISVERGIVLEPSAESVLKGESSKSGNNSVILAQ